MTSDDTPTPSAATGAEPADGWPVAVGELDLHLIGEGRHERLWDVLGAHVRTHDGTDGPVAGTSFALWAPNARSVQVVGDFNKLIADPKGDIDAIAAETRYVIQSVSRHIDSINQNMEGAARNMNEFSRQIRANPGLLLSGAKPQDPNQK